MADRVSSPIFVGRETELARIEAGLRAARDGRPAFYLIAGEAGVGKTRFIRETGLRAAEGGALVLEGGCVSIGRDGAPLGPIVEALRGLTRTMAREELVDLLGPGLAELSPLLPQLVPIAGSRAALGGSDDAGQGRLFEQLLLLMERLADRQPLVLVIEDLHWADRSTLELLAFLGRNVSTGPIILIGTYRTDELHRRHQLLPFLAEQERAGRATRIVLERFSRREVAIQIEGILGAPPDVHIVDAILARSDGNAFYTEELLSGGEAQQELPDSLRDVLLDRVARLTEPTQAFLRAAAASDSEVAPDLIASVLGLARATVDEALREAVSLHVLLPRPKDGSERYSFRHALLQEAIYGELLPGERSRIHAELADVLTRSAPAARDAGLAAEIAHHREASHDVPGAFDAWLAAALAAEQLGALAQALAYLEHALDLWDRVPDAAARSPLDRVEVLRRAALLAEGATPAKSIAYVRQAIALVDPLVEPARAGLLHERLGQYGTYTTSLAARRAAYETAVRLVPPEPPSEERAWVLAGFGRFLGEIETASDLTIPICREAVAVAESVNARAAQVRALAGSAGRLPWWARWGKAWRPWQVPARSRRSCVTCTSSLVP